ncbi:ABC transporter permease [Frateuria aurantia]
MELRTLLLTLRNHRLAVWLIALEVAIACAVLINAVHLIAQRRQMLSLASGIDESPLAILSLTGFDSDHAVDLNARMLNGLRHIPGVQSVHLVNQLPFGPQAGAAGISLDGPQSHHSFGVVDYVMADPGSFQVMGLRLASGRLPGSDEYQASDGFLPPSSEVLVSQALASAAWPGQNPLGKVFWMDKTRLHVIGTIAQLTRADPEGYAPGQGGWTVFVPTLSSPGLAGSYLLQAPPRLVQRVLRDASQASARLAPDAVVDQADSKTALDMHRDYFRNDRIMVRLLSGIIMAMLVITGFGVIGLTSLWVSQRRRYIGIRRAIGATRGDILRYFQLENLLIISLGVFIGLILARVLNLALMRYYELPSLPWSYLPIGAVAMWLLGQLAVLGPAMRAAAVPPITALRDR